MAAVKYVPVGSANSSFKQPRQKIWGVFARPLLVSNETVKDTFELVLMTNDMQEAKTTVNNWLKNPPTGNTRTGLDNIILTEIIPVDSSVDLG